MNVSRTFGFILSMSLAAAVLFSAATSSAQQPSEGQQLVEKRCQGCHTMRRVETSAKDANGWQRNHPGDDPGRRRDRGERDPGDGAVPDARARPRPGRAGKQILLNTCTMCHNLQRIKNGRRSA